MNKSISPFFIDGNYHYMTTLTRTSVDEHGFTHSHHHSLMICTKSRYFSEKEFVEDVTKKLKSGNHTPCDFARIRVNPNENDWAIDGVRTVDSRPFFNWIREECNYILVTF